ncbi:hypothetical protein K4H00_25075, partial [Mycobacterium tuberculosis]|nr:hypothetical protein [Mycobacterium tuberculosis]
GRFGAVGLGAVSLGRDRRVPAADDRPPGAPVAALGPRRPPRPAPVAPPGAAVAPSLATSLDVHLLAAVGFARPAPPLLEVAPG